MKASSPMTENLILFADKLRSRGFTAISMTEVGDAVFILSSVGLEDRQAVKASLKSLFASTERECRIFDEEFDSFFVGEKVVIEKQKQQEVVEQAKIERLNQVREELEEYDLPQEIAEAYDSVNEKRQQWLKDMVNRVKSSPRNLPIAEEYIKKIATGWLAGEGGTGLSGREETEDDLLHKSLASITEDEAPKALAIIEMLVRRINGAEERRYRRSGRDGIPDLRGTIHSSMSTGGVPVHPKYKKRRRSSRRFVILCDVSESMYRFSGFALRFITALGNTANRASAYIFSEGFLEISLRDLQNFEENVKKSPLWRKGTDVGSAINGLLEMDNQVLNQDAVLVILSDAKTVNLPMAQAALADAERRCRSILWLNPDRDENKSALALAEHCNMLGCGTLDELSKACASVTRI